MTEPSTREPESIRDPVVCNTPACHGPATIWQIGRVMIKVCQGCAGIWHTSLYSEEMFPPQGWPLGGIKR